MLPAGRLPDVFVNMPPAVRLPDLFGYAFSSTPLCFVNLPPGGRLFLLVNLDTVPGPDPENHISTREPGAGDFLRGLPEAMTFTTLNFRINYKLKRRPAKSVIQTVMSGETPRSYQLDR